jgi:predicted DNA-binding transcriptional regulator AlpA
MEGVKLMNIKDLCTQYSLPVWTVRSYCSQGKIPYVKIGARVYFRPSDIDHWIEQQAKPVQEACVQ